MSQVRNLRAMFEQKKEASPPDRGRGEALPPQSTESPRPLSRVRTNFITVEKDGRVGLQRDPSSDSVNSLARRVSGGTEGEPTALTISRTNSNTTGADDKDKIEAAGQPNAAAAAAAQSPKRYVVPIAEKTAPVTPPKTTAVTSPRATPGALPRTWMPTQAQAALSTTTPNESRERREQEQNVDSGPVAAKAGHHDEKAKAHLASPRKDTEANTAFRGGGRQPALEGHKKALAAPANGTTGKSPARAVTPSAVVASSATNGTASVAPAAASRSAGTPASSSGIPIRTKAATGTTAGGNNKEAAKLTAVAKSEKSVPKTISTSKANAKPTVKSPGLAVKTPTSPAKPLAHKIASKTPEKQVTPAISDATPKSAASASVTGRSAASSATKKPPSIQTFPPNGIGFVKPKPKSPTRPVQLPPGLTTHTASSATKMNVPRQSLSRQSGNFHLAHQPVVRSPSRASISTVGTTTTTTGERRLRRQNSALNRPRPSIGPPPKLPARDHPVTKKEKEVDQSFLARMMRPTQSSASKTADKTSLTPPRKQTSTVAKKPVARNVHGAHPKQHNNASASTKVNPPRAPSMIASAAPITALPVANSSKTEIPPAEKATPAVQPTATAEEVVDAVKEESVVVPEIKPDEPEEAKSEPPEIQGQIATAEVAEEAQVPQHDGSNGAEPEPISEVVSTVVNGADGADGADGANGAHNPNETSDVNDVSDNLKTEAKTGQEAVTVASIDPTAQETEDSVKKATDVQNGATADEAKEI
ncbi:hypothetical protein SPI_08538 [Niveomyces insectorum RCEF 264]|uniref:Mucin-7 n=1 Tax=Niveomyces insectorum RCEF 264 TaxID=1081102 RepID=A0A167N2A2_9HYPO|nr:hypothetical protein SPI_08538 [Niveomyces insectorum RCEF 264]